MTFRKTTGATSRQKALRTIKDFGGTSKRSEDLFDGIIRMLISGSPYIKAAKKARAVANTKRTLTAGGGRGQHRLSTATRGTSESTKNIHLGKTKRLTCTSSVD